MVSPMFFKATSLRGATLPMPGTRVHAITFIEADTHPPENRPVLQASGGSRIGDAARKNPGGYLLADHCSGTWPWARYPTKLGSGAASFDLLPQARDVTG